MATTRASSRRTQLTNPGSVCTRRLTNPSTVITGGSFDKSTIGSLAYLTACLPSSTSLYLSVLGFKVQVFGFTHEDLRLDIPESRLWV